MAEIRIYADVQELTHAAADYFVEIGQKAITAHGKFNVALSGGSTPKALYVLLATEAFARKVDWEHVRVFWGDERCVPPDDAESNYRLARETLLDHVPLPSENIRRVRGELEPAQTADEYDTFLRQYFDGEPGPRFDLLWLGMGDDGHTASLFPGTAALDEPARWVVTNYVESKQTWRITLTPPAINTARNIAFLVSGSAKAERLRQVLKGPYQPHQFPAQIVKPTSSNLVWLVDAEAAALL